MRWQPNSQSDLPAWGWVIVVFLFLLVFLFQYDQFSTALKQCQAQGYTAVIRGAGELFTYHCVK
jgi:hypothetical protein